MPGVGGRRMEDNMLVLVREEFWKQTAPNSPFIDIEQFRNNFITISRSPGGKPSEKSLTKKKKKKGVSWQTHTGCGL